MMVIVGFLPPYHNINIDDLKKTIMIMIMMIIMMATLEIVLY